MNPYQEVLQELLRNLTQFHGMNLVPLTRQVNTGTPQQRQAAINRMVENVGHLGQFVRNYQQKLMAAHQKAKVASSSVEELVKFADYLDESGFHALADKITDMVALVKKADEADIIPIEKARKSKEKEKEYEVISESRGDGYVLATLMGLIAERLKQHADQLEWGKTEELKPKIYEDMRHMAKVLWKHADRIKDVQTFSSATYDLTRLANWLDENGFYALADKVDESLGLIKTAEDYGYCPQAGKASENQPPLQPIHEGSLSTRYCPDHIGVQAVRIDDHTYQCPLDGKEYNYETGYVNYEGQGVPGGSVAAQTPMESNYGGIPMRFYDSRSDVLSRLT